MLGYALLWSSIYGLEFKPCQWSQHERPDQLGLFRLCGTTARKCHHLIPISFSKTQDSIRDLFKKLMPITQSASHYVKTWKLSSKILQPKLKGKRTTPRVSIGQRFTALGCVKFSFFKKYFDLEKNYKFHYQGVTHLLPCRILFRLCNQKSLFGCTHFGSQLKISMFLSVVSCEVCLRVNPLAQTFLY